MSPVLPGGSQCNPPRVFESTVNYPPALLTAELIRRHYLPISRRAFFSWVSSGRLPKADVSIGGKVRLWKRETIESWIESHASEGTA